MAIDIEIHIEEWRMKFLREGYEFDDLKEIGIYSLKLLPYKRHNSHKRDQREFIAFPITYWQEIEPMEVEDYSRTCFDRLMLQEQAVMRQTLEKYSVVVFPVIASAFVDSIAISHIQRYNARRGEHIELPVLYDLEMDMVYMRQMNPGKGEPFFDAFRAEVEYILKG